VTLNATLGAALLLLGCLPQNTAADRLEARIAQLEADGGSGNVVESGLGALLGGLGNRVNALWATGVGGDTNSVDASYATILGGANNVVSENSVIAP